MTTVELTSAAEHVAFIARDEPADIVVLAGLLSAQRDPLIALKAVGERCRTAVVVQTPAIAIGGRAGTRLWQFGAAGWTPTRAGLEGLCLAAGFGRVEVLGDHEPAPASGETATWHMVMRAWR